MISDDTIVQGNRLIAVRHCQVFWPPQFLPAFQPPGAAIEELDRGGAVVAAGFHDDLVLLADPAGLLDVRRGGATGVHGAGPSMMVTYPWPRTAVRRWSRAFASANALSRSAYLMALCECDEHERESVKSRSGGEHVDTQRGLVPRGIGTAVLQRAVRQDVSPSAEPLPHSRRQTRTHGGVGPVAGSLSQSRGPDSPRESIQ